MRELRQFLHRREGERAFPAVIHHPDRYTNLAGGWHLCSGGHDETVNVMALDEADARATLEYHYYRTPWELLS